MKICIFNSVDNTVYELVDDKNATKSGSSYNCDECDLGLDGMCIDCVLSCKTFRNFRIKGISQSDMKKLATNLIIFRYNELSRSVEDACSLDELSDEDTISKLCINGIFKENKEFPLSRYDKSYLNRRSRTSWMSQLFSLESLSNKLCTDDMCLYYKDDLSCMEGERCLLREICGKTRDEVREMRFINLYMDTRNLMIYNSHLEYYDKEI